MRKPVGAVLLLLLAIALGCSDSNYARVTIHLGDQDLARAESPSLIDRVLRLMATRAEAVAGWQSTYDSLKVVAEGDGLVLAQASIPVEATRFSIEVPAGADRTITVYARNDSYGINYGGTARVDLAPGDDVSVSIRMLQMVPITGVNGDYGSYVYITWDTANQVGAASVIGYKVHRSTNDDGPYSLAGETSYPYLYDDGTILPLSDGTFYFYRVSVVTSLGEGVPSTPMGDTYIYNNNL